MLTATDVLPASDLDEILTVSGPDLVQLAGARIFLTGATGYIGTWLVAGLLHANRELGLRLRLVALTRNPSSVLGRLPQLASDPSLTLHQGDVRSFAPPAGEFTHLVHGATDVASPASALEMLDSAYLGSRRALDFAVQQGARRALLLSSGAVYGDVRNLTSALVEDLAHAPLPSDRGSAYGMSKLLLEQLGTEYSATTGLACVSSRLFAQLGPYLPLDLHFAAGNFIRDGLAGGPIRVQGDGTPVRSYMYGTDLASWLIALLVRGPAGHAVNTGSPLGVPLAQLAQEVAVHCGLTAQDVSIQRTRAADSRSGHYVPDTTTASEGLRLTLRVPLDEAIERTVRWYRREERS